MSAAADVLEMDPAVLTLAALDVRDKMAKEPMPGVLKAREPTGAGGISCSALLVAASEEPPAATVVAEATVHADDARVVDEECAAVATTALFALATRMDRAGSGAMALGAAAMCTARVACMGDRAMPWPGGEGTEGLSGAMGASWQWVVIASGSKAENGGTDDHDAEGQARLRIAMDQR